MAITDRLAHLFVQFRRAVVVSLCSLVLIWLLFFDSHSVLSRVQLHREQSALQADNQELKARILELEELLGHSLTAEEVEKIAREQYGMSKDGETIYPLLEQ